MILFIGLRGETGADSYNYQYFFEQKTTTIWDWKLIERGYAESGFYYLSVILKSISNNINFYFICISILTLFFLIKSINRMSIYPMLSFSVYYARFLIFRDMNQIRAALAIAVVMYALRFLVKQDNKKYFWLILCATTLHYSACIALVFLWIYKVRVSTKGVLKIMFLSALIGGIGGTMLKSLLLSTGFGIFLTYVDTNNLGIINPVILFQILFCFLFFYFEKVLRDKQYGYYVLRNAYLFSTVILLLTFNLGEIGGRLSTIFATCEIFIIPSIIYAIRPRIAGYFFIVAIIIFIFYLNYSKILLLPEVWRYNIYL